MKTRITFLFLIIAGSISAQSLITRNGYVKFYSHAPIEDIEAINKQVSSRIDLSTGNFAFLVPIKAFVFEKALMQEHFNENYLESDQYPNATFTGVITDMDDVDFKMDGEYIVTFRGTMTIHGVERPISEPATITIKNGKVSLETVFDISPEEYGVEIPASKRDNIASSVKVTVKMDYEKK